MYISSKGALLLIKISTNQGEDKHHAAFTDEYFLNSQMPKGKQEEQSVSPKPHSVFCGSLNDDLFLKSNIRTESVDFHGFHYRYLQYCMSCQGSLNCNVKNCSP